MKIQTFIVGRVVPELHRVIHRCSRDLAFLDGVPAETKAFGFVAYELYLGIDSVASWDAGMFCTVKDAGFAAVRHGSYQVRVLGHISSFVDFALMWDLLRYVELCGRGILLGDTVTADLLCLRVIVGRICFQTERQLEVCDL